jgi:hypothetical protein
VQLQRGARSRSWGGMPGASSATVNSTSSGVEHAEMQMRVPAGVWRWAFTRRLVTGRAPEFRVEGSKPGQPDGAGTRPGRRGTLRLGGAAANS